MARGRFGAVRLAAARRGCMVGEAQSRLRLLAEFSASEKSGKQPQIFST